MPCDRWAQPPSLPEWCDALVLGARGARDRSARDRRGRARPRIRCSAIRCASTPDGVAPRRVLVDDSITTCTLEQSILEERPLPSADGSRWDGPVEGTSRSAVPTVPAAIVVAPCRRCRRRRCGSKIRHPLAVSGHHQREHRARGSGVRADAYRRISFDQRIFGHGSNSSGSPLFSCSSPSISTIRELLVGTGERHPDHGDGWLGPDGLERSKMHDVVLADSWIPSPPAFDTPLMMASRSTKEIMVDSDSTDQDIMVSG